MPTVSATFSRDLDRIPITTDGITLISNNKVFTGNNTTVNVPIFTVTGAVEIRGIWGVITTTLGNHTAAYWRVNDSTNTPAITLATGTTLSSKTAGGVIVKKGLAAAALVLLDTAAAVVSEPTTLETPYFSPFVVNANVSATSNIEYTYTTTDTPTSGAITFYVRFIPVSQGGVISII